MRKPSIIILGPAGCGKTTHAEALRKHYGLKRIIDTGANLSRNYTIPSHGALVLTCDPMNAPPGVRTISFAKAFAEASLRKL